MRLLRYFALASLVVAIGGCEHVPMLQLAGPSLGLGGETSAYPVTRAQVDAMPYASISVRIGTGARAYVVLARYDGDALHWISSNRVVLVTRHGRLIRTEGFPRDLRYSDGPSPDPLLPGRPLPEPALKREAVLDVSAPDEYNVGMELTYAPEADERIMILDRPHDTVRVRETVRVAAWGWRAENYYWLDKATGFVWKSRQSYCPQMPTLEIEVLKRPA